MELKNNIFTLPRQMAILVQATAAQRTRVRPEAPPDLRPDTQNDLHFPWPSFLLPFIKKEVQNRKKKMKRTGLAPFLHKSFKAEG